MTNRQWITRSSESIEYAWIAEGAIITGNLHDFARAVRFADEAGLSVVGLWKVQDNALVHVKPEFERLGEWVEIRAGGDSSSYCLA